MLNELASPFRILFSSRAAHRHALPLAAAIAGVYLLSGCASTGTEAGANVRVATESNVAGCQRLGPVDGLGTRQRGQGDPAGPTSVNHARNAAARLGGNTLVVQERDRPVLHGRSGTRYLTRGMAYRCP